jgi:hypothetical protein
VQPKQRHQEWRLDAAKCSQLLAALASLNHLTDDVWQAVLQPYLPAAAAAAATGPPEAPAAEAREWVPLMCWAAAVGNCCSCRSAVLQLVKGYSSSWDETTVEWRCQLYQAHMWLQDSVAAEVAADITAAPAGEAEADTAAATAAVSPVISAGVSSSTVSRAARAVQAGLVCTSSNRAPLSKTGTCSSSAEQAAWCY